MNPQKFAIKTLVISISAALSMNATANSTETEKTQLPRIDVVGTSSNAIAKQPGSVAIVTKEDLELMQPLSTEDALRKVPGIHIKGEEETAVVANYAVRGLRADQNKTLVLEDGVPVAPSLFLGDGRYYNPRIQRMESIEVLKGAASLRYGPSTIGGVINYKTKTPDDGVAITGRVGSFGLKEMTLDAGGSLNEGKVFGGLSFTKADSDGFQDKDYVMQDLMLKAGIQISDNQFIAFKATHYENKANISYRGLFVDDFNTGQSYNPAPDDYFLTSRDAIDVNHEWQINPNLKLNTLLYWSEMNRDYWRFGINEAQSVAAGRWVYTDTVTGNNRAFDRKGIDSRLSINSDLWGLKNESEVGIRIMNETRDNQQVSASRNTPRTGTLSAHTQEEAKSLAFYGQNRFILNEALAITAGLRVENYDQERTQLIASGASNYKNATTSNSEVMPGLGVTYQITPIAQVFGGIYRAFSPAQVAEALDGYSDQKLEAEQSTNIEIGVRGANTRFNYEVTTFQMDFSNQIVAGNSDPNLLRSNAGSTLHQGLEAGLGYILGGGFSVDTNITFIPVSKSTSGTYDGKRLPYAPELLANAALNYKTGGLKTSLSVHHTSTQYADASNQEVIGGTGANGVGGVWSGQLDAYTVMDLNAFYKVNKQIDVFGAVKNLADERYIAGLRQGIYAGPSRSFELGAKVKF